MECLMNYTFRLTELIELKQLQTLQDNFSKSIGVAIVIVNEKGMPITKPSGFSTFCKLSRASVSQQDKCFQCDNAGGRAAMSANKPVVYRCCCDFVEFAVPIIVNGQYLGAFISGQVQVEQEKQQTIPYILGRTSEWENNAKLVQAHQQANYIPYDRFEAAAYSLSNIALYLAEQAYANKIQKELHAKSIKLAEELRNRADLERALCDAEYKVLSYQINPHFLFNVLNTIGRLAFLEDAEQTENTVYYFSDMMRYILKKSDNKLITIGSEVNAVKSYLAIQQIRLKDRFSYKINIPDKYLDIASPFLVLQPLVENCFKYVIEPKEEKSFISLSAYDDGHDVLLEVSDNGDGIPADKINEILSDDVQENNHNSIGIKNIQNRLRLLFGQRYGLEIKSPNKPNMGTIVRLRFPMEQNNIRELPYV